MSHTKEIVTAVGTLACAIGIGFVMQSSDAAEMLYGGNTSQAQPEIIEEDALLEVQGITLTSAEIETPTILPVLDAAVTTAAAPQSSLQPPVIPDLPSRALTTPSCEVTATALPVAAAMVDLVLFAPCQPNERVTVHHNGMMFTETTSAAGTLKVTAPALTQDAVFVMAFSNGEGAIAQATVDSIAFYDRVVLQWKGNTGFQIHAREFGADYGQQGHVWSGAARGIEAATRGEGGFITQYGDVNAPDPLLAEVYSFPVGTNRQDGVVDLSVEAEVTAKNCGLEIEAQSLELTKSGVKSQDLTLAVPDCDAIGNFLVLNNLLQDLKVAAK